MEAYCELGVEALIDAAGTPARTGGRLMHAGVVARRFREVIEHV